MPKIPLLDLFSGIGGFSYALRSITTTVAYCEIDPAARHVLTQHMKSGKLDSAEIFPDIRLLGKHDFSNNKVKSPVLITAGSPCLDISSLNPKGHGISGSRSSIVIEIFRLVDQLKSVKFVLLENSNMMMTRGLEFITEEFRKRSFDIAHCIVSASEVGAPHLRRRWWCLAVKAGHSLATLTKIHSLSYSWSHEPVPRVLPRRFPHVYRDIVIRGRLLGNSVVPHCVVMALHILVSALTCRSQPTNRHKLLRTNTVVVQRHRDIEPIVLRKPESPTYLIEAHSDRPIIHLNYRGLNVIKKLWATPVATSWRQCVLSSQRSDKLLANQIFYDVVTIAYMKAYARSIDTSLNFGDPMFISRKWCVNPEFIEWMMGYPLRWTKFSE